ncbi:MAG: nitrous oxide reductase accessory protein NosL [Elusimicrobia bacterium]|nr:nitrous oxide reductase accessory protein NosL [Elusimicrobiota bacterium]
MKKIALAAALVLSACARSSNDLPEIHYGRDACARCGMIVSEERFASGYIGAGGETVAYDDLGEFLDAVSKEPALAAKSYVHDAQDGRWLRAAQAVFVKLEGFATPMGSGYAAFASEKEAGDFATRLGKRLEGPVVTLAPR